MMRKKPSVFIYILIVISCTFITYVHGVVEARIDTERIHEAKKLFLEGNIALSEKRFADAHAIAEGLISYHADDPQIWLYMHFYIHTFDFLDENFQKGMLRPIPPGIQKRIDELKAKENKTVIDLVTLTWVADYEAGDFSSTYLEQIIQKFPNSVWADWAETELAFANISGRGTVTKERSAAFYNFCTKFMKTHPDTHLMPRLLRIAACARQRMSQDKQANNETTRMYQQVLDNYPSAEYDCARARRMLRELLGNEYKEPVGCTAEQDRLITLFYFQKPEISEYKKNTVNYVQMIEQVQADTKPALPLPSYLLITPLLAIAIAVLIFLLKKNAIIRSK